MSESSVPAVIQPKPRASQVLSLLTGIEPAMMLDTIKAQCFKGDPSRVSDAQLAAFVSIAADMGVNPLLPGMMYAFPVQGGGIVPMMGPDGVFKKLAEHREVESWETIVYPEDVTQAPTHATTKIFRKGSDKPLTYTALMSEWKVAANPNWGSRPRHMLSLRALKQCARQVIHGVPYDEDERVIMGAIDVTPEAEAPARPAPKPRVARGAAAAKENAAPAGGKEVVVTEAEQAAAQASTPPPAHEPPPAATGGAPLKAEQRALLHDGEVITVEATVDEFKVVVGKRDKADFPYIKAVITSPELKGNVSHVEGGLVDGKPVPAWQLDRPVRLTIRGKKYANLSMANVVDKIEVIEAAAHAPQGQDEV